jgi:prepilin signal peptidase PulO-like enzyme (type II secretory pathway)
MVLLAALLLVAGLAVLAILTVIDFRTMLLPDKYTLLYAVLAILFHLVTGFIFLSWQAVLIGAIVGGGFLALIRWGGNWYYKMESMGLGDVKLLIGGGAWLGAQMTILAITIGAFMTLVFAIGAAALKAKKTGEKIDLYRLEVPAGPGFCVGLAAMMLYAYGGLLVP